MDRPNRVLIVENDEDLLTRLQNYAGGLGYQVRVARDLASAQGELEHDPDLVLLSLDIPNLPGLQFLNTIHAGRANRSVLVISGEQDEELALLALSSGAADFLLRPVRMAEVAVKIQNQLELMENRARLQLLNTKLEREKRLLTRYFSQDIVEQILVEAVSPELGGENVEAVALFLDIRRSTSIAETLEPQVFAGFISSLFTEFMGLIFDEKGSVNKLMGDGILAVFGAPIPTGDDAERALRCALRMREHLNVYNQKLPDYLTEPVEVGIGIAGGRLFAGNIGSPTRMEYTVLGDPVNTAARLQSLTKKTKSDILCDDMVRNGAGELQGSLQLLGQARLRGKKEGQSIFRLRADAALPQPETTVEIDLEPEPEPGAIGAVGPRPLTT